MVCAIIPDKYVTLMLSSTVSISIDMMVVHVMLVKIAGNMDVTHFELFEDPIGLIHIYDITTYQNIAIENNLQDFHHIWSNGFQTNCSSTRLSN